MTPAELEYIRGFIKDRSGLVLSNEKKYLLESRLTPVARKADLETLSDLVAALKNPAKKQLHEDVVEAMTTNESFFFRDKTPFDHFNDTMVPHFLDARRSARRLRIWCAAASTGQEPYSLAICLKEMAAKVNGWTSDILGTDLSADVLEKAKVGLYSQFEVQRGLPIQLLLKYFTQTGDTWQINGDLRAMIKWRQFNLLESYRSLGRFDIIYCRNVLIYFDQETKCDVLDRMAAQLEPDGYLVLGAAETVVGLTDTFKPVSGKRGLYQKNAEAVGAGQQPPLRAAAS